MRKLSRLELEAKELINAECKRHYNKGGCFIGCKCRINGKCKATTEDNRWNTDLIEILKAMEDVEHD
jgi:hypothetical protein